MDTMRQGARVPEEQDGAGSDLVASRSAFSRSGVGLPAPDAAPAGLLDARAVAGDRPNWNRTIVVHGSLG